MTLGSWPATGAFTPVRVGYALSDAQKRYVRRIFDGVIVFAMVVLGSTLNAAATILRIVHEPAQQPAMLASNITLLVLNVALIAAAAVVLRRGANVAMRGDVTLTGDGLRGSLDGRPFALPWRQVESVLDSDGLWIFSVKLRRLAQFRRDAWKRIVIPKSALTDPAATWSQIDELLVAKRGLIRRPGTRAAIYNSALR